MKKKWRALSIFLIVLMTVSLFGGCNGNDEKPETTPRTPDATTTPPAVVDTTTEEPALKTFGGRKFTISSAWIDGMWRAFPDQSLLEAEKQEIYDNLEIDLDIEIELLQGESRVDNVIPVLMAGDIPADLCDWKVHGWMPLAVQGLILSLDDPRLVEGGLDVNDPQAFFQPFTQAQNWNGKIYGAMWNGSHFLCEFGWCIYFNKALLADAGVTDLYKVVRDGDWDWDYFRDLAKKTTQDYDNDGVMDVYGIGTFGYGTEIFTTPGAEIVRNI